VRHVRKSAVAAIRLAGAGSPLATRVRIGLAVCATQEADKALRAACGELLAAPGAGDGGAPAAPPPQAAPAAGATPMAKLPPASLKKKKAGGGQGWLAVHGGLLPGDACIPQLDLFPDFFPLLFVSQEMEVAYGYTQPGCVSGIDFDEGAGYTFLDPLLD